VEIQERYRSRDHTERLLTYLRYSLKREGNTWILEEDLSHEGFSLPIPRDPSSASFFAFLSAMRGDGEISFPEILLNPTRLQFFFWLERMGVKLRWEVQEKEPEEWGTLSLSGKVTTSVEVKPEEIPLGIDELPLLMLSGLFLESGMEVRGAEELRKKESDRIRVTGEIARAFGGEVEELPDGLRVFPGKGVRKKERVVIDPHGDHRMAMAGVVTGIALGVPVEVLSGEVVRVSFPNFFSLLSRTGVAVVEKV
jgi:3-phosphoshikimate 1-carboxyvinyltransferase